MTTLASELFTSHPALMNPVVESDSGPITAMLYGRLPHDFDARLIDTLTQQGRPDLVARLTALRDLPREYQRTVLHYGAFFYTDEVCELVGVRSVNPPPEVHSMVREEFFAGDFYFCDMIASALAEAQFTVIEAGTYLDFGASSGRVVSNMRAAYPDTTWLACDPQEKSIEWARANLDHAIEFFVSPLSPPLAGIANNYFDGVFAISIWSHFSERAALAWFAEIYRCLKPGGWLLFTTHGPNTLHHYALHGLKLDNDIRAIHAALFRRGYVFEDVFGPSGDWTIPATDWGMCYMLPSWVVLNLVGRGGWSINHFMVGRGASNQDLYLLVKV